MHFSELSIRAQDYLKVMWDLAEHSGGESVSLRELAERTGQKTPTASEAMKRLAAQGLVEHERYAGLALTPEGREVAMALVRRHRLLETFLVEVLGYGWDEVHEDADLLEHACSDRFIARLDAHLGSPAVDPHGDPIPDAAGAIAAVELTTLADVPLGATAQVVRVCDGDPDLLRYLDSFGVRPGKGVKVVGEVAGMCEVECSGQRFHIARTAAHEINVSSQTKD